MTTNIPKVSVIVPVYNREKTITPCIESILNSEFDNFEVLLIDDGSTDSTKSVCVRLASCDSRIKFYSKPNEGVSIARNLGLSKAQGEWVTFVDSDDAILPYHLNVSEREYDKDVDLLMTEHTSGQIKEGKLVTNISTHSLSDVVTAANAAVYLFNDFKPFQNPVYPIWNKFFRRKILVDHTVSFDTTMSLGEDQVFLCDYLVYAKGIVHYKIKSYINVGWPNLTHLGSKLRTPSDYLYNQRKNYRSLCNVAKLTNRGGEEYAVNYGIDRPITRILYNYTKVKNRHLLAQNELLRFTKEEITPYLKSIDVTKYKAMNFNVRLVYDMLMNDIPKLAIAYCWVYNLVLPLYNFPYRIVRKIKGIFFR